MVTGLGKWFDMGQGDLRTCQSLELPKMLLKTNSDPIPGKEIHGRSQEPGGHSRSWVKSCLLSVTLPGPQFSLSVQWE